MLPADISIGSYRRKRHNELCEYMEQDSHQDDASSAVVHHDKYPRRENNPRESKTHGSR